jgi:hypothetical protein
MLKRAAVIAHLNRAGLSLGVAGRIVYAAPYLENLEFQVVDPWEVYCDAPPEFSPGEGLKIIRPVPDRRTWFHPAHAPAPFRTDYFLYIVNSRFVMLGADKPSSPYGELTPDLTDFIWWERGMFDVNRERSLRNGEMRVSVKGWHDHAKPPFGTFESTADPKTTRFTVKKFSEEDEAAAREASETAVSKLSINASLALRIALRRLLCIEPSQDVPVPHEQRGGPPP